jgi:nucleoside-diphosphate-sugar epimerase
MNYIIIGGTGFIGTHLTNLVIERDPKAKIYNLDIVKPGTPNPVVKDYNPAVLKGKTLKSYWIECDIRKPIGQLPFTPTEDDIIFNFAAVHRTPGHEDHEYFETNIRGAENVITFAEKYGIKKIVFTSSIAPYGAAEQLKEETALPTPNTAYGISKLVAEKIHMIWQVKDTASRQLIILRPGVVFGRGENGNFTRLYWAIRGHKFAYPGRNNTIKACIYVKELVRFMLYCLNNHIEGVELYNCCYEPAYTILHICETMKQVTGLTRWIPDIPNWVIMPTAAVIGALGAPMGICPARVKKLQISTNISGKKMQSSGYVFKWSFEKALEDWYADNDYKGLL